MIILGSLLAYFLVAAVVYRLKWSHQQVGYLRWKNEHAAKFAKAQAKYAQLRSDGYPMTARDNRPRDSFFDYLTSASGVGHRLVWQIPSIVALLWPAAFVAWPIARFLHPTVKVPDRAKIDELESL